jgi:uncharacterized surface protein with fasciclin (FAS1) repeats
MLNRHRNQSITHTASRTLRHVTLLGATSIVLVVTACGSDGGAESDSIASTDPITAMTDPPSDAVTRSSNLVDASADRLDTAAEALGEGDYSMMLQALSLSGLAEELEDRSATILAPSDNAFRALTTDQLGDLFASPATIDDILRRHVLTRAYTFDQLTSLSTVETLSGTTLPVTLTGDRLHIGGATVTQIERLEDQSAAPDEIEVYAVDRVLVDP